VVWIAGKNERRETVAGQLWGYDAYHTLFV
jgi:hypothetical protein